MQTMLRMDKLTIMAMIMSDLIAVFIRISGQRAGRCNLQMYCLKSSNLQTGRDPPLFFLENNNILQLSFEGGAYQEQGCAVGQQNKVERHAQRMELSECISGRRIVLDRLKGMDLLLDLTYFRMKLEEYKGVNNYCYCSE